MFHAHGSLYPSLRTTKMVSATGFGLGSRNLYCLSQATWIKVEGDAYTVGKFVHGIFLDLMLFWVLWEIHIGTLCKGVMQIQKETKTHKTKGVKDANLAWYQVSIETQNWLEQKSTNQNYLFPKLHKHYWIFWTISPTIWYKPDKKPHFKFKSDESETRSKCYKTNTWEQEL